MSGFSNRPVCYRDTAHVTTFGWTNIPMQSKLARKERRLSLRARPSFSHLPLASGRKEALVHSKSMLETLMASRLAA